MLPISYLLHFTSNTTHVVMPPKLEKEIQPIQDLISTCWF